MPWGVIHSKESTGGSKGNLFMFYECLHCLGFICTDTKFTSDFSRVFAGSCKSAWHLRGQSLTSVLKSHSVLFHLMKSFFWSRRGTVPFLPKSPNMTAQDPHRLIERSKLIGCSLWLRLQIRFVWLARFLPCWWFISPLSFCKLVCPYFVIIFFGYYYDILFFMY